jgi:hypothetical protein
MSNHYRTLGIDPDADGATIRAAYLELMRRFHPDRHGGEADREKAQEITAAYEVLRDPDRRAAYDRARTLSFGGAAVAPAPARVRGGHLGRNLFLLVAAGTVGLAYWASQQPLPAPRSHVTATRAMPSEREMAEAEIVPAAPVPVAEPPATEPPVTPKVAPVPLPVEEPMVLPPLPAPRPATVRETAMATPVSRPRPTPTRPAVPVAKPAPAPSAPTKSASNELPELEHHLQLLTDQSVRYGNAAKRGRLFATRDAFVARLGACATDQCKRDAYLRRNQEIAEIMRN